MRVPPEPASNASNRTCLVERHVHGVSDHGALAHAEIVVGAPYRDVPHLIPAEMFGRGVGPAAPLQIGEDAIAALGMQRLEMLAETGLVIHSILDHLNRNRPLPRPGAVKIALPR